MPIRALTLDCAQTLVEVRWHPVDFICAVVEGAADQAPLRPGLESAAARALQDAWPEAAGASRSRDLSVYDAWWEGVLRSVCMEMGVDFDPGKIAGSADQVLYGEGGVYRLYPDTLPALQALRAQGLRLAVLSNWDLSLHRVLARFGISPHLEFALASDEEGLHKPDPAFFHLAAERLGLPPEDILHVGDNPIDDLQGARAAGFPAVLIDRDRPDSTPTAIRSLLELPDRLSLP